MEDRRTAFAIFLCIALIMVYTQLVFPPPPAPATPASGEVVSGSPVSNTQAAPVVAKSSPVAPVSVTAAPSHSRPTAEQLAKAPMTSVENSLAFFGITHLGARLREVDLKQFKQKLHDAGNLEMVSFVDGGALPLTVYSGEISDEGVLYTLDAAPTADQKYSVTNQELVLTFRGTLPGGNGITKTYRFYPDSYLFDLEVKLSSPTRDQLPIWVEWSHFVSEQEVKESANPKKFTLLDSANKIKNTFAKDVQPGFTELGAGQWLGIDDYYFLEALIPLQPNVATRSGKDGETFFVRVAGSTTGGQFKIYTGPKEISRLKAVGYQIERSVDLGVFSFLAHPILALLKFSYNFLGNYGLAIIFLTLLIKLAFLPLTQASFKSMQAMQDLQPEIKALRERIDDPTLLNQEMMALYKKRGVNPLGGCLPILIQIPVFFGLYNALLNSIDLRHAPFALWINDLSAPEQLQVMGIPVPLMILIMGASMLIQQWTTPSAMDPQQKKIMMMMPVMFTFMFIIHPMPSGLVLYWLVNNVISIVQQAYLRSSKQASPLKGTAYASLGIFTLGYVLVLLT